MKQFNSYLKYVFLACVAILMVACSGVGSCNSSDVQGEIHTFPNGSKLYGVTNFTIAAGESYSGVYTLKGGQAPFLLGLSTTFQAPNLTNKKLSSPNLDCNDATICGTFNPAELVITQNNNESNSTLTVKVGSELAVGKNILTLWATYGGEGVTPKIESIGVIIVNVTAPTPNPNGSLAWSSSNVSYPVLGESVVQLTYTGSNPPLVTLNTESLSISVSPNNGTSNVCDFSKGLICNITVTGGDTGSYTISPVVSTTLSLSNLSVVVFPTYSYVAEYGNGVGNVYKCAITKSSGELDGDTCTISNGGLDNSSPYNFSPITLGFATYNDIQYAYVGSASYYGGDSNLYTCTVSKVNGDLENCQVTNGGVQTDDLYNLAVYQNNIYITDWGNGNLVVCPINQTNGQPENCQESSYFKTTYSAGIDSITFYNGYAYVAGFSAREVYKCSVLNGGGLDFASCIIESEFSTLNYGPTGITFGFNTAYVADWSTGNIAVCPLDAQGDFVSCSGVALPSGAKPEQITLKGSSLFVADGYQNNAIWLCPVNPANGSVNANACAATPSNAPSWSPGQLVFNPFQSI